MRFHWLPALAAVLCLTLSLPDPATAASRGGGGRSPSFSRPAARPAAPSSSFSRPSDSAPSAPASSSTPSSSATGFSRPGATAAPAASAPRLSAADQAMSKRVSSESYTRYQSQKSSAESRFQQPGSVAPNTYGYQPAGTYRSYDDLSSYRRNYYGGYGWNAPGYAYMSRPSFGLWDAMFMWWMLDSISSHGHDRFFYDNRSDPGYQDWRKEADRLAQDNTQLKEKLTAMDQRVAGLEKDGAVATPGALPEDVKPDVALAADHVVTPELDRGAAFSPTPKPSDSGSNWLLWIVGGGLLFGIFALPRLLRRSGGAA